MSFEQKSTVAIVPAFGTLFTTTVSVGSVTEAGHPVMSDKLSIE